MAYMNIKVENMTDAQVTDCIENIKNALTALPPTTFKEVKKAVRNLQKAATDTDNTLRMKYLENVILMLDQLDNDDYFGTEGWRQYLNL